MPKSTPTPPQNNHALVLALETLNDEAVALRADLTQARIETAQWRQLALEAIRLLHEWSQDTSACEVAS